MPIIRHHSLCTEACLCVQRHIITRWQFKLSVYRSTCVKTSMTKQWLLNFHWNCLRNCTYYFTRSVVLLSSFLCGIWAEYCVDSFVACYSNFRIVFIVVLMLMLPSWKRDLNFNESFTWLDKAYKCIYFGKGQHLHSTQHQRIKIWNLKTWLVISVFAL